MDTNIEPSLVSGWLCEASWEANLQPQAAGAGLHYFLSTGLGMES